MPDTLYAQIGAGVMLAVCLFAFVKGEEPERIGAGGYLMGWFVALLIRKEGDLYGLDLILGLIDVGMLALLGWLAWRSGRSWPVWACGCQLLIVISYILSVIEVRPPVASFYTVINLAGYGVLAALAVGTFWVWQERRAAGVD